MDPPDSTASRARLGQRFHMTLLFSDLCDYTSLSEACDPEDIGTLKQEMEFAAKRVIAKYEGAVNQFYGDGILAVFGYPAPEEDDVRHAIGAALELHESFRALRADFPLPPRFQIRLHSGVHSGLVFVREGDSLHGRYELAGDAVNTAQRLCSAAGRDAIFVSRTTLSGLEPFFETEEVDPLVLKGKERPMSAYRVLRRSDVDARFEARHRRGLTPFVGRALELERLQQTLADAALGQRRIVRIVGPAGIGKSRLLDTFRRRLPPDVGIFSGYCEHFGNVAPLRPFSQALRQACLSGPELPAPEALERVRQWLLAIDPSLGEHLPALLRLLSLAPVPSPAGPERAQLDVVAALTALFAKLGARQTVVLVLDDWQWADDASKQALGSVLRAVSQQRVLILVGSRPVESDAFLWGDALTMDLRPFTYEESTWAIRALLPNTLGLGVSAAIHRRSGGSPLFLEELCRSLPTESPSGPLDARIPTTIHGLIQARVARLPPDQSELLRAAAVIGNEFSLWLLEKSSGIPNSKAIIAKMAEDDLIYSGETDETFHFKHGITRDVIHESVPIHARRSLHGAVARAIEERFGANLAEQYEALAYHYAESSNYERAVDYAELAGDKARATSALDRARFQYAAALGALDMQAPSAAGWKRWFEISGKWADACVYNPAREQLSLLRRTAGHARELRAHAALANAEYWTGWIHYALGEQESAIAHFEAALDLVRQVEIPNLRTQLLANLGQSYAAACEYESAFRNLDEVISLNRARAESKSGRRLAVGFAYSLGCRATVRADRGDFRLAHDDMNEALAMVRGFGHPVEGSLLALLGMVHVWQGEWASCLETVRRAGTIAEQVTGFYVLAMSQTIGAYAHWMVDRSLEALVELRQGVEWLEARDIGLFLSFNYGNLSDALVTSNQIAPARDFADRALRRIAQKDPLGETTAYRALARAALLEGNGNEVQSCLERARESARRRESPREIALTRLLEGEVSADAGDQDAAERALREARAAFDEMGMTWHRARAGQLLDEL